MVTTALTAGGKQKLVEHIEIEFHDDVDLRIVLTGAGVGWYFLDTRCRGHRSVDPREPLFPSICQQPSRTLYLCAVYTAVTCSPLPRTLNIHRAGKLGRNGARSPLERYLLLGKISLVVVTGQRADTSNIGISLTRQGVRV